MGHINETKILTDPDSSLDIKKKSLGPSEETVVSGGSPWKVVNLDEGNTSISVVFQEQKTSFAEGVVLEPRYKVTFMAGWLSPKFS